MNNIKRDDASPVYKSETHSSTRATQPESSPATQVGIVHTPLTDWLDSQDVMLTLHISERTLFNYRQRGILPFTRFAGKIFYRRSDLEALLDQNYNMYNNLKN